MADEKLNLLQQQYSQRGNLLADIKRSLQTVKDEYEEKLKAVESKYTAQKAVVLRLEESVMELYKMKPVGSLNMILPEPDKIGNLVSKVFGYWYDGLLILLFMHLLSNRISNELLNYVRLHSTDAFNKTNLNDDLQI